jgi:hypothetical protein
MTLGRFDRAVSLVLLSGLLLIAGATHLAGQAPDCAAIKARFKTLQATVASNQQQLTSTENALKECVANRRRSKEKVDCTPLEERIKTLKTMIADDTAELGKLAGTIKQYCD